jgi:alpha-L-rhamnosidase
MFIFQLGGSAAWSQSETLISLRCEQKENPTGIDTREPRFSWKWKSNKSNLRQSAYEIRVSENRESMIKGKNLYWNSGKVMSDESVYRPYQGQALKSGQRLFWQARAWDQNGKATPWSAVQVFQMGLLDSADWQASWIKAGVPEDSANRPSPLFRTTFQTSNKLIKKATLYISSLGMYQAFLNGMKVGEDYLTPGWTAYRTRIQYQQYNVTGMIQKGENAIGVMLGSGWYRGFIGFSGQRDFYGKTLALICQLQIMYTDGSTQTILSNDAWKTSTGEVIDAEIYHGETIDARKAQTGWYTARFADSDWRPAQLHREKTPTLVATYNEPVRKHETIKVVKLMTTPRGEKVLDFGQNLVGWVQVRLRGMPGDTVQLSHAEVLDKDGNFYTDNLRAAKQQNTYILKGGDEEFFEPHFTFQGFRYVRVDNWPGELRSSAFTAVALYSDMATTGQFTCSNKMVNQLQKNILWGQKGNFLDVPTDCPQRDERLGWTGDAQAFARTATFNMQVQNFFSKWLKDLAADQFGNGGVPFVVPNVLGPNAGNACGWADAATIIPWTMYQAYGDVKILEDQYASMKAWVGYLQSVSKNDLWNSGFHFGDWLFYTMDNDVSGRAAVTDKYLIAQCFYAYSADILSKTAAVLGKTEDQAFYANLTDKVKQAFLREYCTSNGRLVSNTQTAYTLALYMDMLPQELRTQAAGRLAENVKEYGNHLTTGFLGTPYLCHVLSRFGHNDLAYTLLLQETYPSWLYPVKMGATTIWERWNGIKTDSSFETPSMNSFNHYAYGAIGDWLYRVVAGIDTDPAYPGYRKIIIRPQIGPGLTHARAEQETPYGRVVSGWKKENNQIILDITVPPNTDAKLILPVGKPEMVQESGKDAGKLKDGWQVDPATGLVTAVLGSGTYQFKCTLAEKL